MAYRLPHTNNQAASSSTSSGTGSYQIPVPYFIGVQRTAVPNSSNPPNDLGSLQRKYDSVMSLLKSKEAELEKYRKYYQSHKPSPSGDSSAQVADLKKKLEDAENAHKEERRSLATAKERYTIELEAKQRKIKDCEQSVSVLTKRLSDVRANAQAYKDAQEREFRLKVRSLEQERDKLTKRLEEAGDLRKTLIQVEDRNRASAMDYRKRIAELQTTLQNERDKSAKDLAGLQQKYDEIARNSRNELSAAHKNLANLEAQRQTDKETQQSEIGKQLDALREELDCHRKAQSILTKEYARLSENTVPRSKYEKASLKTASLELQVVGLKQHLSEFEEQVRNLAVHLRHARSENALLEAELNERESAIEWYSASSDSGVSVFDEIQNDSSFYREIDELLFEEAAFRAESAKLVTEYLEMSCMLHRESGREMVSELIMKNQDFKEEQDAKKTAIQELFKVREKVTDLSSENEAQKKRTKDLQDQNVENLCSISDLKLKLESSARALMDEQNCAKAELAKKEDLLKKEREITTRLSSTLQKEKMKEEALKAEVDQLAQSLAEAEAYRAAFYELSEEMKGLIARSVLAEEEADRISKFNAEILGHHNPTQRIYYVDRIRKELAELKQKLVISTQSLATLGDENESLRKELSTYKSVSVPIQGKPRTNMTRIQRVPLSTIQSAYNDPIPKDDWVDLGADV